MELAKGNEKKWTKRKQEQIRGLKDHRQEQDKQTKKWNGWSRREKMIKCQRNEGVINENRRGKVKQKEKRQEKKIKKDKRKKNRKKQEQEKKEKRKKKKGGQRW
eukprot:TRINITY_DN25527_c2_g1_i1.p3 TRINITY_DN25527_c2_g1~~TRINITY_DN25527_c2_g1_i1.p3  ORF type:complete len:104 (+),score=21.68 TRINITY_DN25527_c2_g1_i1:14-325(+)